MKKDILDNPRNVTFNKLLALCSSYFGEPRISGSHHIFKTPWSGDPRANLQRDGKMAKPYRAFQVKKAIEKLEKNHEA
jgi:hypothetical protein